MSDNVNCCNYHYTIVFQTESKLSKIELRFQQQIDALYMYTNYYALG